MKTHLRFNWQEPYRSEYRKIIRLSLTEVSSRVIRNLVLSGYQGSLTSTPTMKNSKNDNTLKISMFFFQCCFSVPILSPERKGIL